ncbi:DNA-methyltransferase Dcm [Owenweeksia hongkongensis DSM 17368]|uniref:DNA (cytosine-5-)-methyltransferase n=1 Tax=Owenweeksia hongkongensis (strain DSM 17368 / CIP 108786 / JCM 12287 / NRRL B-23963 / UST20020801) TaxID=926562 RepID=G8R875_OWEHD|nr:DNA (cytosine-5-)-methyltransferase [Owenweeksia hongkongensis]AEV32443.1 DNA-methyltransferase Dcm [Owenweeksia hongkongensis DSM 17368]
MSIPVIDIFAGPGGLGEGFSSLVENDKRVFNIKLSIEKDENAHQTLELRSFTRQFIKGKLPEKYYELLRETSLDKREEKRVSLFNTYPKQTKIAKNEAWLCELGNPKFPSDLIDSRISKALNQSKNWLLIGGPPCQAYSLVGRSRVGGIDAKDHRVYLYKEYLRIIAKHHPSVFVMENVKGLLSAKVGEEKVFDWILRDLTKPGSVFEEHNSPEYKIYSLTKKPDSFDANGNPLYENNTDYLIKSEQYGVPQKRHRVILLGIRKDLDIQPSVLAKVSKEVTLESIIDDLPIIRSGISKSLISSSIVKGRKKHIYEKVENTDENWTKLTKQFKKEIVSWNGFAENPKTSNQPSSFGAEFIKYNTPSETNPLRAWYKDDKLGGVCNHESRSHLVQDLKRYLFAAIYTEHYHRFPRMQDFAEHQKELLPDHASAESGKFNDRFRVQLPNTAATTVTSHISKDGHYFIHYDPAQCRSFTVREAARVQTFPDNYLFCGSRTAQFHQVGNAVPPYLAKQIGNVVHDIFKQIKSLTKD